MAKARGLFAARGLDVNLLSASDPEYSGSYHGEDDPSGKGDFVTPCQKVFTKKNVPRLREFSDVRVLAVA